MKCIQLIKAFVYFFWRIKDLTKELGALGVISVKKKKISTAIK